MPDPAWAHCQPIDQRKKKVQCNFCGKIISGGINRFKYHLAGIKGEVVQCKQVTDDVAETMRKFLATYSNNKEQKEREEEEIGALGLEVDMESSESEEVEVVTTEKGSKGLKRKQNAGGCSNQTQVINKKSKQVMRKHKYKQIKLKTSISLAEARENVAVAISRFFYHAAIPFNAADSPYFGAMVNKIAEYGQGLKRPSRKEIAGKFLKKEIGTIEDNLKELKASWKQIGCTIMADGWTDQTNKSLINFLVYCPRGVYFLSSIDASGISKDKVNLANLFDKVVKNIGVENVIQTITDNQASYKAAGKFLADEKYKTFYWAPCTAHCIDLILEDIAKLNKVESCIEKGRKISKFIYNHCWVLNLMREKFTKGRDFIRPASTKFATHYIALGCLMTHRRELRRMFDSDEWLNSRYAKLVVGKEVEKIVRSRTFWTQVHSICKCFAPLVKVLKLVDGDQKPTLPFVYAEMEKAFFAISNAHGDDLEQKDIVNSIIVTRWDDQLHHPLHAAAYFLNPRYRYREDFTEAPHVLRGLNDVICRLEPNNEKRVAASLGITDYFTAKGDYGTQLAIATRSTLDPGSWWRQHGISCSELTRIAVRVLSQTCTSSGCERNWSTFDQIHTKRRNRLSQKRLNDLVYVHYNLRLRERQLRKSKTPLALENAMLENPIDQWMEGPESQEQEDFLVHDMDVEGVELELDDDEDDVYDFDTIGGEGNVPSASSGGED